MKELILYIVNQLVTKPEGVKLDEQSTEDTINFLLTVDPADMGFVIGKSGQTIRAIRKLLMVRAVAEGIKKRVFLTLEEVK